MLNTVGLEMSSLVSLLETLPKVYLFIQQTFIKTELLSVPFKSCCSTTREFTYQEKQSIQILLSYPQGYREKLVRSYHWTVLVVNPSRLARNCLAFSRLLWCIGLPSEVENAFRGEGY